MSTNHNLSEEKGEPKRYRTEVLPLTSLTPYRWAKPAHDESQEAPCSYLEAFTDRFRCGTNAMTFGHPLNTALAFSGND